MKEGSSPWRGQGGSIDAGGVRGVNEKLGGVNGKGGVRGVNVKGGVKKVVEGSTSGRGQGGSMGSRGSKGSTGGVKGGKGVSS